MNLTKEIIKQVEQYIKSGMSQEDCISYLGVCKTSFYAYKKKGEALIDKIENDEINKKKLTLKEKLYINFANTLKKAQIDNKMRCVTIIQKSAETSWQAAAWFLERRYFDEYGKKEKHEIEGKVDTKLEHTITFK